MPYQNYEGWLKKEYWTTEETSHLFLPNEGFFRELVKFGTPPIESLQMILDRASAEGTIPAKDTKLGYLIKPIDALSWAKTNNFPLPAELNDFYDSLRISNKRGRPSAKKDILAEAKRRAQSGEIEKSWIEECIYLAKYGQQIPPHIHYSVDSIKTMYRRSQHDVYINQKR